MALCHCHMRAFAAPGVTVHAHSRDRQVGRRRSPFCSPPLRMRAEARRRAGRLLQGQDRRAHHLDRRRRRARHQWTHCRAPSRPSTSRASPPSSPKNMPGAGHIRAANYVFSQAPKDGTTIGTFIPIFVMAQVLERSKSIQFNPAEFPVAGVDLVEQFDGLCRGSATGVKTMEDAMQRQVLMGGDRRRLLHHDLSDRHEQRARHQVQARHRLSRAPPRSRIAMERGEIAGPRRQQFQQPEVRARRMAARRQDQSPGAGRT